MSQQAVARGRGFLADRGPLSAASFAEPTGSRATSMQHSIAVSADEPGLADLPGPPEHASRPVVAVVVPCEPPRDALRATRFGRRSAKEQRLVDANIAWPGARPDDHHVDPVVGELLRPAPRIQFLPVR